MNVHIGLCARIKYKGAHRIGTTTPESPENMAFRSMRHILRCHQTHYFHHNKCLYSIENDWMLSLSKRLFVTIVEPVDNSKKKKAKKRIKKRCETIPLYQYKSYMNDRTFTTLQKLSDDWYHHKDINVRNLGVYLNNIVDGYKDCIKKDRNFGYVKFGTYSRTFCEVLCNYILKQEGKDMTLKKKMDKLTEQINDFPYEKMNYIRLTTNKIVHGVEYNEDAKNRFITDGEQQQLLLNIRDIANWLKIK
eukprot:470910_1